ncbi:hypothetical protein SAY86_003623 [Trapa natans]|uniref:HhH-GPD domain-containing protein n=1 Tax=Trapa natans TaxID=22666 RepID=A0AAN7RMZ4_TRANT|nr:hypothetical protein SAY86_003623 [Trapa natans]
MGLTAQEIEAAVAAREVAVLELPLGDAAETFSLEKAVCSHGLFMMAPNRWDSVTRTFSRPLRLSNDLDGEGEPSSSVMVRISHDSSFLQIRVYGNSALSREHEKSLLHQVRRMLRLMENDEKDVRGFQEMCKNMEASAAVKNFGGRVFRSPTLFEDMVKCILLCNCQWSRTLDMANALCELQLELQHSSPNSSGSEASVKIMENQKAKCEDFVPKTPAPKETKRRHVTMMKGDDLSRKFSGVEQVLKMDVAAKVEDGKHVKNACQGASCEESDHCNKIGNFPTARELYMLDEFFLAKRCKLGYRASRIVKLSQDIVEGKIQLRQLEDICVTRNLQSYSELMDHLKVINGFGPFTCANVLMCMGFYHTIPADSETVRHLKQVHAKNSSSKTVDRDVGEIYAKYAPYQFLTYWAEIWNFYEKTFGKLSAMPYTDYRLITANNMRPKGNQINKRRKLI